MSGRKLILFVSVIAALIVIGPGASNSRAEVCGMASSVILNVTDSGGQQITEQNKAGRYEDLVFSVNICPDDYWSDNFGNSRFGDYAFQRSMFDQPQGGNYWEVTSGGLKTSYFVYVDDPVSPPPPPPPPPPPTSDYDAAGSTSVSSLAYIGSYLNSNGVTIRCWSNADVGGSRQSWGRWPWGRKVIQKVWVCGPTGGNLTQIRVETSFTTDSFCRLGPGGKTTTRISGGVGSHTVRWLSRAYFQCDMTWPLDWLPTLNDSLWIDVTYTTGPVATGQGGRN